MLSCCAFAVLLSYLAPPQLPSATAGTIEGVVTDQTGAVVPGAAVKIVYRISGYEQTATTGATGSFHFRGVPFNPYHLTVEATGFQPFQKDVPVRSAVPIELKISLQLAAEATSVEVHSESGDLLETVPTPHTDMDRNLLNNLPAGSPGTGLSQAITLGAPGVVADSNGFFHPLGEHSDTAFSIDNQPITDQQSQNYSNQLPLNIFQSIEVLSGAIPPEYGDKTSLVVNANTRSGLGATRPTGSLSAQYGSFGTAAEDFTIGFGGPKWGNFAALNSSRSGRYLDSPEFSPLHDIGNNQRIFDRFDYQPGTFDSFHFNVYLARSWFQIPNTWEQQFAGQDQRQLIRTWNLSPGWVHLFGANTSLTVTPYARQDRVGYFPSRDVFSDIPATLAQQRRLTNLGLKVDLSHIHGRHNIKIGATGGHTFLTENFSFGITSPDFNAGDSAVPSLVPFDLTRGGSLFRFHGHADIKEESVYAQDTITIGRATVMGGLRVDNYNGLVHDSAVEPRLGFTYLIKPTATVLRASYARMFETPYNENLVLSSSTGAGGLAANVFGAFGQRPLAPGRRNQFNVGFEQALGKAFVVEGDYFWKFTDNAFDFDVLFNTPLAFPIEWRKSKVNGLAMRITLPATHGFSAFTALGHTTARVFGPEIGGLIFNSPVQTGVFRIDHDQAFEQTTYVRYQHGKTGPFADFTWRYDSGMVSGEVPDFASALALSADAQQQMGLFCGNVFATIGSPLAGCSAPNFGATRVSLPAPGAFNPDTNPARIASRNLFDVSLGTDNLLHTDRPRYTLRLSVLNLTNKAALYNFLSTFSGTHFVAPRTWQAQIGLVF